jgi:glycosyltransferase involved in cell wall biosynthesis
VPSENTKKDLARYCQVAPEKISVIYHGAPLRKAEEKIKGQGGFNVLCVGRIERRKNLAAAVRAFGKFLDKIGETPGASGDEIRLILAGRRGFGWEEVRREITRSPYGKNIMEKGYVSHEEKDKLYADADVLLFPTLAEGFGLPVLEAMSYGVPVIASKIPVLTEVAGNGALLVEPTDEQGFADALWNIYASISAGEELVAKGYENLARFSWEKCAEETWKVLTEWG